MVAYSFKHRFIEPILAGTKDQTIRAPRRDLRHARVGQALQLYSGMRTADCKLILRTSCSERHSVLLLWRPIIEFTVDGLPLPADQYESFARRDGFESLADMEEFWAGRGDLFGGEIIRWSKALEGSA